MNWIFKPFCKMFNMIKMSPLIALIILLVMMYVITIGSYVYREYSRFSYEFHYDRAVQNVPVYITSITKALPVVNTNLALRYQRIQNEYRIIGQAIAGGESKKVVAKMYDTTTRKYLKLREEELECMQREMFLIQFSKALQDVKPIGATE